jgi:hypothetical protein
MADDLLSNEVFKVHETFLTAWFCAPKSMGREAVQRHLVRHYPSGTTAGWVLSEPDAEAITPSPGQCEDDSDRQHWEAGC